MKGKILSLVMALVLLGALLIAVFPVTPASAGTLAWSPEPGLPGSDPTVNQLVPGSDVTDLAVASDNTTIYAISSTGTDSVRGVYKSTNGGTSWVRLSSIGLNVPTANLSSPALVAVAPGDANTVMVAGDGTEVYLSTDGGATFIQLTGHTMMGINDIAISPPMADVRFVALAGISGGLADVQYLNIGTLVSAWVSMTGTYWGGSAFSGNSSVKAIAFSPNFALDFTMVAVTKTPGAILFEVANFSSQGLNGVAGFAGYPVTVRVGTVISASIALAPTYLGADETARLAFVGLVDGTNTGGVYRLNNTTVTDMGVPFDFTSVAYNGTDLVVGANGNTLVEFSANPTATIPTVSEATFFQWPGGDRKVNVAWAGVNVVAGTTGANSAFAVSKDKGATFNDVSLIDSMIVNMRDFAVSSDGDEVYLVSDDGVNLSFLNVWRRSAGVWQKVLNSWANDTTGWVIRIAPNSPHYIYLVDTHSVDMFFSNDWGETYWGRRSQVEPPVDVAVESALVVYTLTDGGKVYKSIDAGFTWNAGTATGLATGATITSIAPNQLVVGGNDGSVAWSNNGGATWTVKTGSNAPFTSGRIQVTADNTTNGFIYAATSTPGENVMRWKIGLSAAWDDIINGTLTGGARGLVLSSGVLNVLTDNGTDHASRLSRTLMPTTAGGNTVWSSVTTSAGFDKTPQTLKISSTANPRKLWAINNAATDLLYSLTDTVAQSGPNLVSPAEGFQDPVNPVTGRAWDVAFYWNRLSLSNTYQLEIARDSNFMETLLISPISNVQDPVVVMVGPFQTVVPPRNVEFQAGGTYFWRVKATSPLDSPYSAVRSFTVAPLGPVPQLQVNINAPDWVPQGVDFTVPIAINQVNNFDAASYTISFNATSLMLDNVTPGQIGANGNFTTIPVDLWTQNGTGMYNIVQNVPGTAGVSGAGTLAILHFHALGQINTSSDIKITNGALSNNLAQGIPAVWVNDSVYISFFRMGDANGDGLVNALDITKVERIIAGLDP